MASISSIGVGSGIDLESLVNQIVDAERAPAENRLNLAKTQAEAQISALGSLRLTMSAFQDSLEDLKKASFFGSRNASSGDSSLFTATAGSSADLTGYSIEVFEQAQANKIASATDFTSPASTVGSGTLTIGFAAGNSFNVNVAATDSISDIRDAINSATDNVGITASLITVDAGAGDGSTVSKFVFTSNNTGAAGQIDISVADDDLNDTDNNGLSQFFFDGSQPLDAGNQFDEVSAAQDARIAVDGFTAYSSTNTFSEVINDVTITVLKGADDVLDPPSAGLRITADKSKITAAIETFVASYNELATVFNALTDYDSISNTSGLLTGDSSINALESGIKRVFSDVVDGASGSLNSLAFLGIATNRNGSISLDSDKLADVITNRFDDLGSLFASEDGVATQLDSLLNSYLNSGGVFDNRNSNLTTTLRDIEDQRADLDFRLNVIEERYRSRFSALDILVSQLNSTGDFLLQQLDAAARIVNRDNS